MIRSAGLALLGVLCLAGCGDEGVLVAVSGDDVDALRFHVGVERGSSYVLDKGVSGLRVDVTGRRLRTDPYELLLQQEAEAGLKVRVFVLGLRKGTGGEQIYSFGLTEPPQPFVTGKVVRRAISLQTFGSGRSVAQLGGCYRLRLGEDVFTVVPDDDRDCDGSARPADCNDGDAEIHPGTPEYCDGKDNDCDGKQAPAHVACFGLDGDSCRAGTRGCAEAQGGGLQGECLVAGEPVPRAFCQAYADCAAPDPQRCALGVTPKRRSCQLQRRPGGDPCGPGTIKLERPIWTEVCHWSVVSTGGFQVSIADPGACTTELAVKPPASGEPGGPVVVEFFADGKAGWVWESTITMVDAEPCSENPLLCP